jgi:chlorite dismutase
VNYTLSAEVGKGDLPGPIRGGTPALEADDPPRTRTILNAMAHSTEARRGPEPPDLSERGGVKDGVPQRSDVRLFMQFLAFTGCADAKPLAGALAAAGIGAVLYDDVNDPRGIGLLTFSQDPGLFVDRVRTLLNTPPFASLTHKPEYTMLGRTYSIGYEPDLRDILLDRPRRTVLNPAWPWAIWYPLRRSGRFTQLPADEQRVILAEHGAIGMSFGAGDYAHDIRLACHGLDKEDNDFVVGLVGKELFPLSAIVQSMRKTQQTSLYLERLGPFFVGRVAWQSPSPAST